MRLIDADALKEEIRTKDIMGGLNYQAFIRNAPTIEMQQPCEDAISRQAVIDMIEGFIADATSHGISPRLDPYYVMNGIKSLPTVTPKQKVGWWVKNDWTPICSCCGKYKYADIDGSIYDDVWFPNYCPNCGAKMQESEDKE